MTPLLVFEENKPCLELRAANIDPYYLKIPAKIAAALKLLTLREQHVLVQFWWPREVGMSRLVATLDQPFGLGVTDEMIWSYRRDSESKSFVVDKGHEEEDHSPAARVLRRGLPEWTFDVDNYAPEHFPQLECAVRCNLHGYLGLPVFDLNTRLCVGVLEVLTSAKYTSYAYEVEQIHMALKTENLTSPQGFDFPALYVPNEHKQNDLDEIWGIMKTVCDVLNLPLAQTWALSQHCSFVAREKVIEKSCSSFDTRCVGIVCMSTAGLPYYVKDLCMWYFREACIERHLDMSCGLVGEALLTRGSCFCGDVTKLGEQQYPLVHNARKNGLTSCFAIFLCSIEASDDYVLEFFLPPGIEDSSGQVLHLVQTLKQSFEVASRFELGDTSIIKNVGPSTDMCVTMVSDVTQSSSECMDDNIMFLMYSSDSESLYSTVTKMVTAKITFIDVVKFFKFPISWGLSYLENKVAQSFKLEGEILLKYKDEENDLIRIANDVDLKFAVDTTAINNSINLICQPSA